MRPVRILLYGVFTPQSYERCWLDWLRAYDYDVATFERGRAAGALSAPVFRIFWKFRPEIPAWREGRALVRQVRAVSPDLLLIVSGCLLTAAALDEIRTFSPAKIIHFYNEDYFNPLNTKPFMLGAASRYDHVFTTKSFNVAELKQRGVTNVSYVPHGYRPNCHYPVAVSAENRKQYGADVAFVGTWERPRALDLESLSEFDIKIWGGRWRKLSPASALSPAVQNREVYGEEASTVFNASKINLAFLRKANRDLHTSRTFEIPACGGFQLSERTGEVREFFEETREIECFGCAEEMKDKVRYYLSHETQRARIAAAGLERVRRSKYSFTDRLEVVMRRFHEMRSS